MREGLKEEIERGLRCWLKGQVIIGPLLHQLHIYVYMYINYLKPINLEPGRWATERVCIEWFLWSAVSAFGDDCPNEGCTGVLLELLRLSSITIVNEDVVAMLECANVTSIPQETSRDRREGERGRKERGTSRASITADP